MLTVCRPASRASAMATSRLFNAERASPSTWPARNLNASSSAAASLPEERPSQQDEYVVLGQWLEPEQCAAGKKRAVDGEEGVLGRSADQRELAGLNRWEQGILLGPVEPVHLVEEQDSTPPLFGQQPPGPVDGLPHVFDPGRNGRKGDKGPFGRPGYEAGQRCLPGARRAPQYG